MQRAAALAILKRHKIELGKLGIVRLSLFGSTARDEASATSDVDLAIEVTKGPRGFAHLERMERMERMERIRKRLAEILDCRVDVIEEPAPSPRVQRAIEQDRVLAF